MTKFFNQAVQLAKKELELVQDVQVQICRRAINESRRAITLKGWEESEHLSKACRGVNHGTVESFLKEHEKVTASKEHDALVMFCTKNDDKIVFNHGGKGLEEDLNHPRGWTSWLNKLPGK